MLGKLRQIDIAAEHYHIILRLTSKLPISFSVTKAIKCNKSYIWFTPTMYHVTLWLFYCDLFEVLGLSGDMLYL